MSFRSRAFLPAFSLKRPAHPDPPRLSDTRETSDNNMQGLPTVGAAAASYDEAKFSTNANGFGENDSSGLPARATWHRLAHHLPTGSKQ